MKSWSLWLPAWEKEVRHPPEPSHNVRPGPCEKKLRRHSARQDLDGGYHLRS